jgi:hypothetical protein
MGEKKIEEKNKMKIVMTSYIGKEQKNEITIDEDGEYEFNFKNLNKIGTTHAEVFFKVGNEKFISFKLKNLPNDNTANIKKKIEKDTKVFIKLICHNFIETNLPFFDNVSIEILIKKINSLNN